MSLKDRLLERIRTLGPMTFAEFMELALYDPESGYYARAPRRSGRAGDFYTSVDVGPLFGEMLAAQLAEMWQVLSETAGEGGTAFDLVEAGAANGQLGRDILDAAAAHPAFYAAIRLHLIERSRTARAVQRRILGPYEGKLATQDSALPGRVHGAIVANELLDALPTHAIVMTPGGLREIVVSARGDDLVEEAAPPSTPALAAYLERLDIRLEPGWRGEINLNAVRWMQDAARGLLRGFLIVIDYGHEARELYSATHAQGTLTTYAGHRAGAPGGGKGPGSPSVSGPPWLAAPGEHDITAHVDLTSVMQAAEREGLQTLGALDQTYFLLGLGLAERLEERAADSSLDSVKRRLAARTLLLPGGLGSTQKVLLFGKGVGTPRLRGCSWGTRIT